jgi:Uma2 family endonuclease
MVTTSPQITIDELEKHGGPEGGWELINGELIELPPDSEIHGQVGGEFHGYLWSHVRSQDLGYVYLSVTSYVVSDNPPTVRKPDVSFNRTGRLPADRNRLGFIRIAPDLVAEVISLSDRMADVLTKVGMWLDFGVPMVLLIAPIAQTVTVFRPDREPRSLSGDQTIDGEEVVPGFSLPVRAIFAPY